MTLEPIDGMPGTCAYCGLTLTWTDNPRPWVDESGARGCAARARLLGLLRPPHSTIVNVFDDGSRDAAVIGLLLAAVIVVLSLGILWAAGSVIE